MKTRMTALTLVAALLALAGCTNDATGAAGSTGADDDQTAGPSAPNAAQEAQAGQGSRIRVSGRPGMALPLRAPSSGIMTAPTLLPTSALVGEAGTAVSASSSTYHFGDVITVSFDAMPGNRSDWIAIAPLNAAPNEFSWWSYTDGAASGSFTTEADDKLPPGTFVVRAFFDDGYTIEAESEPFTIDGSLGTLAAQLTPLKGSYGGLEPVEVTFSGLAGNSNDWIGAFRTWGSMKSFYTRTFTDGLTSGTAELTPMYAGTWELRAFESGTYDLKGRSATTITVTPQVATDLPEYSGSQQVIVRFGGMAGEYANESIAIAQAGSASDTSVLTQNVDWDAGGERSFDVSSLPSGSYVARIFFPNVSGAQAESAAFTITH